MSNIIVKKTLQDIVINEQVYDWINPSDLWNYFLDTPSDQKSEDPYEEFVQLCRMNLGYAAKTIIGTGNFELMPFQQAVLESVWNTTFPVLQMTRGGGKSFLLAVYAILSAVLDQNSVTGQKIILVSASFRQSKEVMTNIQNLFEMSPLLHECCDNPKGMKTLSDRWSIEFGNSIITAIPLGTGERIRGLRATKILCDEFASVPEDIFNVVIRGFGAVSASPVTRVRSVYTRKKLEKMGIDTSALKELKTNQIVRSGTASYNFNHFTKLVRRVEKILRYKLQGYGSDSTIKEKLGEDLTAETEINFKNYSLITLPWDAMPPGYMDENMLHEARISMTKDEFDMEYGAKSLDDSRGFYKASAIDAATPKIKDPASFTVEPGAIRGARYVMGIDPARLSDDFALVIIKCQSGLSRVVYAEKWEKRNYGVISKRIRELVNLYQIERIGIDKGGGGTAVLDFLQTKELIPDGELPYWEILDKEAKAEGLRILDMLNYMGGWLVDANHDMRADIEHKRLLFPISCPDSVKTDALIDAFDLIIEMKRQLISIEVTLTDKKEMEHFDLPPEIKKRQKKDLYSALLIASYEARQINVIEIKRPKWGSSCMGDSLDSL